MSAKDEQVRQDSYKAFESYDFDNDEQFQLGIASLLASNQDNKDQLILKAKLFYYSKFFTPIQYDEYMKWKDENKKGLNLNTENTDKPIRFTFQEIVDMIEKGIEIPGIKQIPNTLNDGTPSQPQMKARPKPWEINKEK
ncbi:hypothetical protein CU097_008778 [Rhizopus azygosporus]|uniref:Uncharacterized protein n=2 Tax=Rhizopus TaxID=4842 RepID=A0A367JLB8_RHIAZ|nr:hypothetical protein BCV71DRAFT_268326 [Rhizopus microsporus]RCH90727.1 hypothetical protein CU097_008778 [Rhizopus azygosporus]